MKSRLPSEYSFRASIPLIVRDSRERCRTPDDVLRLCSEMSDFAQEVFLVIVLNSKNYVLDKVMITQGITDAALVHPREVFRTAIVNAGCAIIIVHNHPSGDHTPSTEDIRVTRQLIEAGRIVDIKVLDHIIIGREAGGHTPGKLSMRETGIIEF